MKFGKITNSAIIGNYAHDNLGVPGNGAPGLWCDVDCDMVMFRNNVVSNNGGGGIAYEISHHGTFAYNVIQNNGGENAGWGWGSGLQINESDHVAAFGNLLAGNHNGIVGVQQRRGSGPQGTYRLESMDIHDNLTRIAASDPGAPGTAAGIFQDDGEREVFSNRHNVFEHNTYSGLAANSRAFQWLDRRRTAEEWRADGNDTNGRFYR
jgi:parallel beta-helix repeat protein